MKERERERERMESRRLCDKKIEMVFRFCLCVMILDRRSFQLEKGEREQASPSKRELMSSKPQKSFFDSKKFSERERVEILKMRRFSQDKLETASDFMKDGAASAWSGMYVFFSFS